MEGQIVIGLAGFVGVGKTTISDNFTHGHGFKRMSFADPIRRMMAALGVPEEDTRDPARKEEPHPALCGRTVRHAMETLGTAWGREMIHPSIWTAQFMLGARNKPFVICDDIRYQNEVDTIRQMGGKVYRIVVPGREPRVPSDHAVVNLTDVEDITNVFGETRLKDIYTYIYGKAFGSISPSGISFEDYQQTR